MNDMFELEVNSFRKTVKDFDCLRSVDKLFHRTAPISRSYFYSNWFVAREQQACFQNL